MHLLQTEGSAVGGGAGGGGIAAATQSGQIAPSPGSESIPRRTGVGARRPYASAINLKPTDKRHCEFLLTTACHTTSAPA